MGGISYNVWLRGLCAGVSWFRLLCFPAECISMRYADMSVSIVLSTCILLWILPLFKHILAHFSNPKFIFMSLVIACTIFYFVLQIGNKIILYIYICMYVCICIYCLFSGFCREAGVKICSNLYALSWDAQQTEPRQSDTQAM
jgi:hypothetical protein